MKQFLFIIALMVGITTANAQSVVLMPLVAGDTLTNADTVDKYLPQFTGGYSGVTIAPFGNKVSGTAAGKVYLYESLLTGVWGAPVDSLAFTNISVNTTVFKRAAPAANFYRLQYVSSGTTVIQTRTRYSTKIFQITP